MFFCFLLSFFVVDDLHLQIIKIISATKHQTSRLYLIIGPLHCRGEGWVEGGKIIKSFCHIIKQNASYFTGSDIYHKSSFCQQSTVTECILNLLDPSTAMGGGQLFLLILCLQIYYWRCFGFRSPKKGILISVLSTAGYFYMI